MEIKTAQDAVEAYKSFDGWEYADREAAWKWMFEQGRLAEREACAKVCEDRPDLKIATTYDWTRQVGQDLALAIRMRSNAI